MNKLKVIQLLPELNVGGVERGTCDFSNALVKNGHKSVVISNGGIYEKDIIQHGGKHINLPIHKKSLFSSVFKYPFMTIKVVFWIHLQAFFLWLRGATFFIHPSKVKN